MSRTVCLAANAFHHLDGGGHLWAYLNLAPGLRALGCRVVWLEAVMPGTAPDTLRESAATLRDRLRRYGLGDSLALCARSEASPPPAVEGCLDAASQADLLLNLVYSLPCAVVARFRRTALMDIVPGLLQIWVSKNQIGDRTARCLCRDLRTPFEFGDRMVDRSAWHRHRTLLDRRLQLELR